MSDYIDRQAAIDAVGFGITHIKAFRTDGTVVELFAVPNEELKKAMDRLAQLPSAEVEPVKRGKWIYDNQFHWYRASCSECGYKRVTDIKAEKWNDWSYCPNCGAKMEAEEADG